jgi:hypothetical protein
MAKSPERSRLPKSVEDSFDGLGLHERLRSQCHSLIHTRMSASSSVGACIARDNGTRLYST